MSILCKNAEFPHKSFQKLLKFAAKLMMFSEMKGKIVIDFRVENLGIKPKNGFNLNCAGAVCVSSMTIKNKNIFLPNFWVNFVNVIKNLISELDLGRNPIV